MFKVSFVYDEECKKWEPIVEGASDETEARQGFTAVVLTVQQLATEHLHHSKVDEIGPGEYRIHPAVKGADNVIRAMGL